jgi:Leucine-rich repeat (LRR) protein
LSGNLLVSLTQCTSLAWVRVQNNRFVGSIPKSLTMLPNLSFLDVSNNNFTGEIPKDLGNLGYLNISGNSFESELSRSIWKTANFQIFSASFSKITGQIPDFFGCKSIYKIELQGNSINGSIPSNIGYCDKLIMLHLEKKSSLEAYLSKWQCFHQ